MEVFVAIFLKDRRVIRMKLSVGSMVLLLSLTGFLVSATTLSALGISSTSFSILARALTLGFSCIALYRAAINTKPHVSAFVLALLAFCIFYLVRIFFDTLIIDRSLAKADYIYWVWAIGASFVPMFAAMTLRQHNVRGMFPWVLMIFVYCSVLAAGFGTSYFSSDGGATAADIGRLSMSSLNPISTGHLGVSTIIVCLFQIISIRSGLSLVSLVAVIGVILGAYLVVVSGSRGPIFAGFCVMLYILVTKGIVRSYMLIIFALPVLYFGIQFALLVQETTDFVTVSRFTATGADNDQSVLGRFSAYSGAIRQTIDSPILGSSLEEFSTGYYPHNVILESFMSTGIYGGMLFFFVHFYIVWRGHLIFNNVASCSWVLFLYIQFLAASMVSGAIWNSTYLWVTLGVCYALLKSLHQGKAR
jgi:hypothetical protein